MTSEKFSLKWNDFQQNITSTYINLHKNMDFADVTLLCEEDKQVEAHKILLSACSSFFSTVLKRNKHPHPMIYMRGVRSKDLLAIVDFIYQGEANIYQEDLDGFLALAEELQLKGLYSTGDVTNDIEEPVQKPTIMEDGRNEMFRKKSEISQLDPKYEEKNAVNSIIPVGADMENIKAQIISMMERVVDGEKKWKCTICGKSSKDKQDVARHVEIHIEGISYPCNQCGTVCSSSNSHKTHVSNKHRK